MKPAIGWQIQIQMMIGKYAHVYSYDIIQKTHIKLSVFLNYVIGTRALQNVLRNFFAGFFK